MLQSPLDAPATAGGTPVRCLVVDDDPLARRAWSGMVGSFGRACREAGDGEEALAVLAEAGEVPLVITDIQMPGVDGIALLRALRQAHPDTVVLMLSGLAEVQTAV